MRVLVTGANGFVGSHIVEELIAAGHTPVCCVRSTSNRQWICELPIEFREGDLRDAETMKKMVQGVDAVIHAAGVLRAATPSAYYEVNQKGTRDLAETALQCNPGLKRFVYISSQAAMGPASSTEPKRPDEPETPVSDYGKSKLAGEKELLLLRGKIPYTILRPASVYGPRDKDIFIFFRLVKWGFRPITSFPRRIQLVYVKDISTAAVRALSSETCRDKTYVLADAQPYTWAQVAATIAEAVGKRTIPLPLPDLAFRVTGAAAEMLASLRGAAAVINRQKVEEMLQNWWVADVSAAPRDLGMDFTKLKIGAKITYSWYSENHWF